MRMPKKSTKTPKKSRIFNYPKITSFSAVFSKRHFGLAVGCADDVDQQEEGGGMKVEGVISGVLLCGARTIR